MRTLKITSLMAQNADAAVAAVVGYLDGRLHVPVSFVDQPPWRERQRRLDAGKIHVAWICGLPYVWRADMPDSRIELLVAPVMRGERYRGRPIYFSDVVVRRESAFETFADLRGASWAYNERGSHSGYNVVRYHLATMDEKASFFGRVVESGAHQTSLRMVLDGEIDASAIDSTVLELEIERDPTIRSRIRVIETLGPSPIPPWVVLRRLPQERKDALRAALLGMRDDPEGRAALSQGPIDHFTVVTDEDYDPIRRMADMARDVPM